MTDEEGEVLSALVLMQEPGECMYARNMKAGLGFDRASEDEMKDRQTVKVCRRGTVFQQGNEEENKECTHETAKLLNRTNNVDNNRKLLALHVSSEGAGRGRGNRIFFFLDGDGGVTSRVRRGFLSLCVVLQMLT